MTLLVVAVTFGLVFVAELPDKTMIASIVLASRYSPRAVWVGTATAMVLNSALAVLAGRLLTLLPHRAVAVVVAALFAGGALYLLIGREEAEEEAGVRAAGRLVGGRRVAMAAFGTIMLAELGDITQVLVANLAAHYRQPWSVFVGSALALVAVTTIGIVGGRALVRVVPFSVIRKVAGVLLLGFAVIAAVQAAR